MPAGEECANDAEAAASVALGPRSNSRNDVNDATATAYDVNGDDDQQEDDVSHAEGLNDCTKCGD